MSDSVNHLRTEAFGLGDQGEELIMSHIDLAGRRILIAEDEHLIVMELTETLAEAGGEIVGPASTVGEALRLLDTEQAPDAALLDVRLMEEYIFPVADWLMERRIPFAFASSYDRYIIPERFAGVEILNKPVNVLAALRMLCQ